MKIKKLGLDTKKIASTAIFTALTCVMTILVRIPVAGGSGYLNFGDIFIFITAICIGPFAGAFAGGVGSCIADLIGYPIYAPFTLVIKGLEGLVCGLMGLLVTKFAMKKPLQIVVGVSGMILGGMIMFAGYFFTDWMLTSLAGAVTGLPFNAIQWGASVGVGAVAVYATQLRRVSEKFGFCKPAKSVVLNPTIENEDTAK